jgi:hypothetical protein
VPEELKFFITPPGKNNLGKTFTFAYQVSDKNSEINEYFNVVFSNIPPFRKNTTYIELLISLEN